LLIAVPIAGILSQFARGNALPLFGIGEIPSPWIRDRAFAHNVTEVHEILANALVVVASFHAAAALVHHFVFRDNTLARMLPRGKAGVGKKSQDSNGE
jgi:cytochrome b561